MGWVFSPENGCFHGHFSGKGGRGITPITPAAPAIPLLVTEEAWDGSDHRETMLMATYSGPEGEDPRRLLLCLSTKTETAIWKGS